MAARLPKPGADDGQWGDILNNFLNQAHNPDGSLKQLSQAQIENLTADLAARVKSDDLKPVATSGDYNDLVNKPALVTSVAGQSGAVSSSEVAEALDTDGTRLSDASLREAFVTAGRGVPGRRLAALGDSITAGIIGQATPNSNNLLQGSYLMYGCMASQGRLEWGGQFGVPGDTCQQILARVDQVVAAKPDICIVLGGTNDGSTVTMKTYLPQILTALIAAGIEPVMATLPPSSSANALSNGPHNFIRQANAWIVEYATTNSIRVIDFFGSLVDPVTGKYKVGYNSDITHPNQTGYRVMGTAIADALAEQVKAGTSWLTQDIGEQTIISGGDGGLFTTGTTLPAGGWEQSVGTAGAFVTDPYFSGRAYQINRSSGDSATRVISRWIGALDWTFQVGDLVSLSCKIKTSGLEASGGIATVGVACTGSTGAANIVAWQIGANFPNGGVVYYEAVVPPGTTTIQISIRIDGGNGNGDTLSVGQFGVRNLTRLANWS